MTIPIVVVNMDKSTDRLEKISNNMRSIGLDFTRFRGINGKELSEEEVEAVTDFTCRNLLCSRSVIGCALSHITIWKNFIKGDYGSADILCVMEDDISVLDGFPKFLNDIHTIREKIDFDIIRVNGAVGTITGTRVSIDDYTFIENPMFPLSTTCYIITKNGAEKALDIFKGSDDNISIPYMVDFSLALGMIIKDNIKYFILVEPLLVSVSLTETSTINSNDNSGILMTILGDSNLKWYLNIPVASITTKYDIPLYSIILVVLLMVGIYHRWIIFSCIVLLELAFSLKLIRGI